MNTERPNLAVKSNEWQRARSILAKSLYNDLKSHGYSANQIIEFSSELLGLVTGDLKAPARMDHTPSK